MLAEEAEREVVPDVQGVDEMSHVGVSPVGACPGVNLVRRVAVWVGGQRRQRERSRGGGVSLPGLITGSVPAHGGTEQDLAGFLQSFLYFGLLFEFFEDDFEDASFLRVITDNEAHLVSAAHEERKDSPCGTHEGAARSTHLFCRKMDGGGDKLSYLLMRVLDDVYGERHGVHMRLGTMMNFIGLLNDWQTR